VDFTEDGLWLGEVLDGINRVGGVAARVGQRDREVIGLDELNAVSIASDPIGHGNRIPIYPDGAEILHLTEGRQEVAARAAELQHRLALELAKGREERVIARHRRHPV
jgi:hypothetical protein